MWKRIVGLSVVTTISIVLLLAKRNSTEGRSFIYKLTYNNIESVGIAGTGGGNFRSVLKEWQSNYFRNGGTKADALRVDNVSFLYSSFILLFVEYGVIGLVLSLILLIFIIKRICVQYKTRESLLDSGNLILLVFAFLFLFTYYLELFYPALIFSLAIIRTESICNIFRFKMTLPNFRFLFPVVTLLFISYNIDSVSC